MRFGQALGTAAVSFAITNIDDAFLLITFFAESARSKTFTPFNIILGQFIGFTIIVAISLIGFGLSLAVPSEPIGFVGLVPILLGVWNLLNLLFPTSEEEPENLRAQGLKAVLKVSLITIANGGDNIGTYIPLFSQAEGAKIAIYVVVFYVLLSVWCLVAFLIARQRHVLALAQKYLGVVLPFLYVGLGVYIVVKSHCYPWSIDRINDSVPRRPGTAILAPITAVLITAAISVMTWLKLSQRQKSDTGNTGVVLEDNRAGQSRQVASSGESHVRDSAHPISASETGYDAAEAQPQEAQLQDTRQN
ncbi:cadmium resistance transporter-domain-containing protein [Xylariaceae sp. FL1019]|nr:cadmium resistance transporter-domain-containing protein [Xylariaceae sp. FL1019]